MDDLPLRRLDGSRFSEVRRAWEGKTTVIIAGGPSMNLDDAELVGRARAGGAIRVIAVNDGYLIAPFADVCYFADAKWWRWHSAGVANVILHLRAEEVCERFAAFRGQKCSIQDSMDGIKDQKVHFLRNSGFPFNRATSISMDPTAVAPGKTSGFQATNLAVLTGARTIVLLGFDARKATDGRGHWFGDHPLPSPDAIFEHMRKAFSAAEDSLKAAGVRVINCSTFSAIDSFPRMSLAEALRA